MKKKFSVEQIVGMLKQAEVGVPVSGSPFRSSCPQLDMRTSESS